MTDQSPAQREISLFSSLHAKKSGRNFSYMVIFTTASVVTTQAVVYVRVTTGICMYSCWKVWYAILPELPQRHVSDSRLLHSLWSAKYWNQFVVIQNGGFIGERYARKFIAKHRAITAEFDHSSHWRGEKAKASVCTISWTSKCNQNSTGTYGGKGHGKLCFQVSFSRSCRYEDVLQL